MTTTVNIHGYTTRRNGNGTQQSNGNGSYRTTMQTRTRNTNNTKRTNRVNSPLKARYRNQLNYDDVFIVPRFSEIASRSDVDVSVTLGNIRLAVPVISSNMDTITGWRMARTMLENGAGAALHRVNTIEEAVEEYRKAVEGLENLTEGAVFCTVGAVPLDENLKRFEALYNAGARNFIIDIAHGHSENMKVMISKIREKYGNDVFLIAGNVATYEGVRDLTYWGADVVKVGIANGSVCWTRRNTGVHVPQFSALLNIFSQDPQRRFKVIADGGLTNYGDVAKAIGAGALAVMSGRLFAGCDECPEEFVHGDRRLYRGLASRGVMDAMGKDRLPEGGEELVVSGGSATNVIFDIKDALQSAMSYSNARNISEFRRKVIFGSMR